MLVHTRVWSAIFLVASVFILPNAANAQIPGSFSTTWDTTQSGTSASDEVIIPYTDTGGPLEVYWEDTASSTINGTSSISTADSTISFPAPGIYRIDMVDYFPNNIFQALVDGDQDKLLTVEQWGDDAPTTFEAMFQATENFVSVPSSEAPDMTVATSTRNMLRGSALNVSINHWDVSNIEDMYQMFFSSGTQYNQPLNDWDTSSVTNMGQMFSYHPTFNQPINNWDVSNVTDMQSMFFFADSFNQPLNDWDVSRVENMSFMLNSADFNQPLNSWDTSSVTNMNGLFGFGADSFDQNLGSWNISNVTNLSNIFRETDMSTENYSATIEGWANRPVQTGLNLGTVGDAGSPTSYFSTVQSARDILTVDNGWTITDGGPVDAFELTYGTTVNATLTGEGNQTVASGTPRTAVTVVPDEGFEFVQWSDGNTDNPRIDTPTTASVSVIAEVAKIETGSSRSSATKVGVRDSAVRDSTPTPDAKDRALVTSEGIAVLSMTPKELETLPDEQKQMVIDILLSLIAILTEILTQMMMGVQE